MIFSSHFSLFFKSCFRKDKKCTDTLIRHKQIFCTNHISSDWLKKIAIRVLTIKSVRGYLFLEIFLRGLCTCFEHPCRSQVGRAPRPPLLAPRPAARPHPAPRRGSLPTRARSLAGPAGCRALKSLAAATAKGKPVQPGQLGCQLGASGFTASPRWLKRKELHQELSQACSQPCSLET